MAHPDDAAGPVVAVVGGGITGLAAALALSSSSSSSSGPSGSSGSAGRDSARPPNVVLLEAEDRTGGKIRTAELAGRPVDAGPDAFLARVPEAVELCRELGLADELVAPATGRARLWIGNRLVTLPEGLVLGVPTRLGPVARSGIISPGGLARGALDLVLPATPTNGDRSVADLVASRLGREVQRVLVDPLLGGINAGRTANLSAAAAAPQLDAAARRSRSLMLGLRSGPRPVAGGPMAEGPVFLTHPGGLAHVVDRLVDELTGRPRVAVRTGAAVTRLERQDGRWALVTPAGAVTADAVVLAVPARAAAALLAPLDAGVAAELGAIPHASVSLVTMAYPSTAFPPRPLDGSGYLVPASEGRLTTACTWTTSKWPHLARSGQVLVRVSTGRFGDDRHARLDDDALVAAVHRELVAAMEVSAIRPHHWQVARWPDAFPQYEVGHLERVKRIETAVGCLPRLAVAGAAYRGIGIPACIRQARQAAAAVMAPPWNEATKD